MVQIKKSSPDKIKSPKDHNTTTMVPDNKDASIFEGGKLFKNGWYVESQKWDQLTKIL